MGASRSFVRRSILENPLLYVAGSVRARKVLSATHRTRARVYTKRIRSECTRRLNFFSETYTSSSRRLFFYQSRFAPPPLPATLPSPPAARFLVQYRPPCPFRSLPRSLSVAIFFPPSLSTSNVVDVYSRNLFIPRSTDVFNSLHGRATSLTCGLS